MYPCIHLSIIYLSIDLCFVNAKYLCIVIIFKFINQSIHPFIYLSLSIKQRVYASKSESFLVQAFSGREKKNRLDQNGAKMGAKMIPLVKGATIGLFTTL